MTTKPYIRGDDLVITVDSDDDKQWAEIVSVKAAPGETLPISIAATVPVSIAAPVAVISGAATLRSSQAVQSRAAAINVALTVGPDTRLTVYLRGTGAGPALTVQIWDRSPAVGEALLHESTTVPKDGKVYALEISPAGGTDTGRIDRTAGILPSLVRVIVTPTGGVFPVTFGCDVYSWP